MSDDKPGKTPETPAVDYEAFGKNWAKMMEEGSKAVAAYMEPRQKGEVSDDKSAEWGDVAKTFGKVYEFWTTDPNRASELQTAYGKQYLDLWTATFKRMTGDTQAPIVSPDARDKRFKDEEWSTNPFFDFLKQAYLLNTQVAQHVVSDADTLDPHTRAKADFYLKQFTNAVAPSNFLWSNPEVLRETFSSNGENLVRGMKMLAEDIVAGRGELRIRQVDADKFEVGRNMALTPGKVVFQNDLIQLIQYEPTTKTVQLRPLLIVPPWINKYYILDLNPEKSFIRWAVEQGITVFTISWVNPDETLAAKTFADYMTEGPIAAIDVIEKITGEKEINTAGYCVGGTMLASTLAYMAAKKDNRIASATFFATQVDFTYAGDLKVFIDEDQVGNTEKMMSEKGYLEGSRMANAFNMLRSQELIWPYVVNNYLKGKQPMAFDLLYWNSDATRMPAANHAYYLRNCYLDNKLAKGEMEINGVKLDLGKVKVPVYNLATKEDHIAPAKSVFVGAQLFGGPVRYVMSGSGHIAGVVNPPSLKKYQYWTGGKPDGEFEAWQAKATEIPGSWWHDWRDWLVDHDASEVPARVPGAGKFKPIEDAPGSYVKAKA
ncbi:poly-beta-hydroxybutyrate polymerase [Variibacter gotjawalensis]|uniref:Poly-beta-hydroxybutyrate polymerase n=1 Tax=Variibacter gotjawalensis TaxID=1333996 RepID=A0A0S3PWR2_9BRAD|nr:class I poly(R)-hydroxyalkanoic acid synthase [Variibacter gotjawalensis]NIK46204.1 polyhydroxyalkanoate synthase [Variibacter gotjawalensis]RZS48121.1 polyhydroxyalkanoate synthase [Variibacter gotjawalensis]BAT60378.1 poly-beta-hydroxybutyrate polymerase [Variibacter gotjawalensis]